MARVVSRHGALALALPALACLWAATRGRGLALPVAMASGRVALVTGANKGIGLEIARKLADAGVTTVIGARNEARGVAAAEELCRAGCTAVSARLDLTDPDSALAAARFVGEEFGRLDILVNNAAVCFNDPTLYGACEFTPFERQAGITVSTNFFGTLAVTRAMLPLLQASSSPRIVNVASYAGRLAILRSREKLEAFTSPTLQVSELEAMMREFVRDAEAGVHARSGWPNTCYGVSKLGIIALTRVMARDEPKAMINSVDPGYCATDQNRNQGVQSAEEGAQTPAALALLPDDRFVSGLLFRDGREVAW